MSRPPRRHFAADDDLRHLVLTVGLVVLGPAIADEVRVRLSRSHRHIDSPGCWCGPQILERETLTTQDLWIHRTKWESN